MQTEEQVRYSNLGDSYWWLAGKYEGIRNLLKDVVNKYHAAGKDTIRILDAGCGPGNVAYNLPSYAKLFSMDATFEAVLFFKQKIRQAETSLVNAQADRLPVLTDSLDIVILLDVLEHIKDDAAAVKEAFRVLKPTGSIIITVPAYRILWGRHDEIYGHYRRYTLRELRQKLETAGFKIKRLTAFEALFFLPLLFYRKFKNVTKSGGGDDFVSVSRPLNYILTKLILAETWFCNKVSHPFGVSIICVAEK